MIFVTLGTQKFQLNRLLIELDQLLEENKIEEKIFAQVGYSEYCPRNYEYAKFLNKEDFFEKIVESSLIITHSGVGSILSAMRYGKPIIVYPRLVKYKEHVDNHQLEIAQAFSKKKFVLCCNEYDDLYKKIHEAKYTQFNTYYSSNQKIIKLIKDFLENIENAS